MEYTLPSHALRGLVTGLSCTAYWQGEAPRFDPQAIVTTAAGNRWSASGEPAIYLAGDGGIALAEAGRHLDAEAPLAFERYVWRMRVSLAAVLDLRGAEARGILGLGDDHWFLDRRRCSEVVAALRSGRVCEGIRTQSAGLPDAADRWNLVIFADLLAAPLSEVVTDVHAVGSIRLGAPDPVAGTADDQAEVPPRNAMSRSMSAVPPRMTAPR